MCRWNSKPAVRDFLKIIPERIDEYEALLTKNPLFSTARCGIGVISSEARPCIWGDRPDAARLPA